MSIPGDYRAFLNLTPEAIQSLTDELVQRTLSAETIERWLHDWVDVEVLFQESLARLDIACDINGADAEAAEKRRIYRETIWPIGEKFSAAMEARLFKHEAILPQNVLPYINRVKSRRRLNQTDELMALVNQEVELRSQYGMLLGTEKNIVWQGKTLSEHEAESLLTSEDTKVREGIQQALDTRRQRERDAILQIWRKLLDTRQSLAEKNGFANYLEYRWYEMERHDYTPDDSHALHRAFLTYWSPLYERILAMEKASRGEASEPNKPFKDAADLSAKVGRLFHRLDPEFGAEYDRHVKLGLLNIIDSGASWGFTRGVGRTGIFIWVNINGEPWDAVGLIHEMGHVFSLVASARQPYHFFYGFPFDFGETPSSTMETLSMPYWDALFDGMTLSQIKREHFKGVVRNSLHDVISEAFQLWVYSHLDEAHDAEKCSAKWFELHQTYMPNPDWLTKRDEVATGWQYHHAFIHAPFFGMEYAYGRLAGLNLLRMDDAPARYKQAIALGNSVSAKDLFAALGTRFFFTTVDVAAAAKQVEAESYSLTD